jgi:hypothetical protein
LDAISSTVFFSPRYKKLELDAPQSHRFKIEIQK